MERKKIFTTAALIVVVASFIGMMFGIGLFNKKTNNSFIINDYLLQENNPYTIVEYKYYTLCGQELDMTIDTTIYTMDMDGDYILVDNINKDGFIIDRDTLRIFKSEPNISSVDTVYVE